MIDQESGVEVFVRRYGDKTHYDEFYAPESSARRTEAKNACYIEARTGERYEVVVRWPRSRLSVRYPDAHAELYIDQKWICSYSFKSDSIQKWPCKFAFQPVFRNSRGREKKYGLVFQETSTAEANEENKGDAGSAVGHINVVVTKGKQGKRYLREASPEPGQMTGKVNVTEKSSIKKGLSHFSKCDLLIPWKCFTLTEAIVSSTAGMPRRENLVNFVMHLGQERTDVSSLSYMPHKNIFGVHTFLGVELLKYRP